jgi:hypothetical protein
MVLQARPNWFSKQVELSIGDNPRLQSDIRRGKSFFTVSPQQRLKGSGASTNFPEQSSPVNVGSPLGG